jgi:hypothetical protein
MRLHALWQESWQRLRMLGVVGAAGTAVILRLSAAQLMGIQDNRLHAGICQHE